MASHASMIPCLWQSTATLFVYVCLMRKLEKRTGTKWKKFIVGAGRLKIFEDFVRRYRPWLPEDLEVYFIDGDGNVEKLV